MRIAFIDSYYPDFLNTLKLGNGSYQEELDKVLARQFGTADYYSREFRKLGWEVIDIIANYDKLQARWFRENPEYDRTDDRAAVFCQIHQFRPDVVFIQDLSLFSLPELKQLRREYLLVAQLSCAFTDNERVKQFHTIFTSFPHYIPKLKALGVNAVYMPLAFHESVLKSPVERDIDVSFVGGIGWQWKKGLEVLEVVARDIPTFKWWGYGVEQLKVDSPLRAKYQGTAWGDEMYAIYQRSKIVINRHGEIAEGFAQNMRMYEATGCGALLLSDNDTDLFEFYNSQRFPKEIVRYVDPEDAVRKIKWYLEHEDERTQFALNGQTCTLKNHTYAHRIPKIAEVLEKALVSA